MTRRGGFSPKYIAIVVIFFACLYGFYCFHNVYTRMKNAEEKTTRLGQQHDSVSAQLQVVYEHKNRLEKSLQQEKTDHQRSKDDMKQQQADLEEKYQNEKNELMGRVDSINQENKMLQMKVDDQELENTKLKEEVSNLQHDAERRDTQHNEEYLQFKQEKEFEVAQLKDEVSNIGRKRQELQYQLDTVMKGQQLNQQQFQQEQSYNIQLQEEILKLKGQLQHQMQGQVAGQHQQFGQQNNYPGQQQQQQNNFPDQQQRQNLNQGQVQYQPQEQGLQGQHQQQNGMQFNPNQQQFAGAHAGVGIDSLQNVNAAHNVPNNAAVHDDSMQINKPDAKKSYFEPNVPAVEDNLEHKLAAEAKHQQDINHDGGQVVLEQVIPPKLNEGNNEDLNLDEVQKNRHKHSDDAEADDFNNQLQDDNAADNEYNNYKENDDNNPGDQKEMQLQKMEPKALGGEMNAANPADPNNLVQAPDGIDVMDHKNDQFGRREADLVAQQHNSNMLHKDAFEANIDDGHDKAMEEGLPVNRNRPVFDPNQDKALERDDFNMDQNAQYQGDQKDQPIDRPPLIGQGLRGGLPQQGDGQMFNVDRNEQQYAPDGFAQQEQ